MRSISVVMAGIGLALSAGCSDNEGNCSPSCSPSYTCVNGACVSACNPPCKQGEICGTDRICRRSDGGSGTSQDVGPGSDAGSTTRDPYVKMSGFRRHFCALRKSGTVVCWEAAGYTQDGETVAPQGKFIDVSAGSGLSCGIRTSGALFCWGSNSSGESQPPSGSFKQVSAGGAFACALRNSGEIVCWGLSRDGRTASPSGTFTLVTAGSQHACALDSSSKAHCWGNNTHGQATAPTGTFKDISAGGDATCVLDTTGKATCWGYRATTKLTSYYSKVHVGTRTYCALSNSGQAQCAYFANVGGEYTMKMPSYAVKQVIGSKSGQDPGVYCLLTMQGAILCLGNVYMPLPYP